MRGRLFLLSVSALLSTTAAIVAACTGDDPDIGAIDDAGTDTNTTGTDGPTGGDSGDGGGGSDGSLPMLTCQLQSATPTLVRKTQPGELIDDNFFLVSTGVEDTFRVVSVIKQTFDYEINTIRLTQTGPDPKGIRHIITTGRIFSQTPMSAGGTALFGAEVVDGSVGQSLVAWELPYVSGQNLPADPTGIALTNVGNVQDVGGRIVELVSGTYYYVVSEKLSDTSFILAGGRGPGGTADAGVISTSTDRFHLDGFTLFHGTNKVYGVLGVGDGPSAQTIAYHLPDNGVISQPVSQTQLTFPGGGPAYLIAGFQSQATAGKLDLFFLNLETDAASPTFVTLYAGQTTDFTPGGSLVVEPPSFGGGSPLTATEVPLGNGGGSGAAAGDTLALIGSGVPDPEAGAPGLNFIMVDSQGRLRAKYAGPGKGFLADRLPRIDRGISMTLASPVIGSVAIFGLAWVEHVTDPDGAIHDEVYLNRIRCF